MFLKSRKSEGGWVGLQRILLVSCVLCGAASGPTELLCSSQAERQLSQSRGRKALCNL